MYITSNYQTYEFAQWSYYALVYDPATETLSFYRDGLIQDRFENVGTSGFPNNGDLYFGANPDGTEKLSGGLDEISVFNRALHPDDIWELYLAADKVMILPGTNEKPLVDAGDDAALFSVAETLTLEGFASDDGLPNYSVLCTSWKMVSGPGEVVFGDEESLSTTATFSTNGVYVLELSADDGIAVVCDTVRVYVDCSGNLTHPPENLIAHWSADGTGRDVVGGFDAYPVGSVTYASSMVGSAFEHGTAGMMLAHTDGELNAGISTNGFSLEFWVRVDSSSTEQVIAGWYDADGTQFSVSKRSSSYRYFIINGRGSDGTVSTLYTSRVTYILGSWHHFVFTYDNATGTLTVYRDGLFRETLALPSGGFLTTGDFCIGGRIGFATTLIGATDEVSVYDRCLRPEEAWYLFDASFGKAAMSDNSAPFVLAGPDLTVTSVASAALLNGAAVDDGLPEDNLNLCWTKLSGPGNVNFNDPANPQSSAYFDAPGIYKLELSADDACVVSRDTVRVEVACTNLLESASGLRAHWPAEGAGSEVVDGFDAYPVGPVTYVPSMVGSAFEHGTAGMMLAHTDGELNAGISTNGFSLEFWVRVD
ncbi:MAG: LamG-like jellyroll fold domain-containing protein, partial [Kiritimatiellia bacterium]